MALQLKCTNCNAGINADDRFCLKCGAAVAEQVLTEKTPLWKQWWFRLALLAGAALLIFILSPPLFFRLISILCTALLVLTITTMVLTFRKAKNVSASSLAISMLVSGISLLIYSRILNADIGQITSIVVLCSGAMIGIGWSFTSRLMLTKTGVRRRGGLGYLIVWGSIFALNQLTALLTGRPPQIAMILLFMSTGLMIGHNLSLLIRAEKLKTEVIEG